MTYRVIWEVDALDAGAGFLRDDPEGMASVFDCVGQFAEDPHQETSRLGTSSLRRLRAGRYRIICRVSHDLMTVSVTHLGRTP